MPKVYCNHCYSIRYVAVGNAPMVVRCHLKMHMAGSRKIGLLLFLFYRLTRLDPEVRLGTYYAFLCPLCGKQEWLLEEDRILRRLH